MKSNRQSSRSIPVPEGNPSPGKPDFRWNRIIGWASLGAGSVSGLMLGLWSFSGPLPPPEWIGEYGEVSRRLLRLAHISLFGLGILNLLMAAEKDRHPSMKLSPTVPLLMNTGNVLMPVLLIAAAIFLPLKYLLPLPALSVSAALLGMAYGVWNHEYRLCGK